MTELRPYLFISNLDCRQENTKHYQIYRELEKILGNSRRTVNPESPERFCRKIGDAKVFIDIQAVQEIRVEQDIAKQNNDSTGKDDPDKAWYLFALKITLIQQTSINNA